LEKADEFIPNLLTVASGYAAEVQLAKAFPLHGAEGY